MSSFIAENGIAKPKQTMLPVLVILFLLSYGLMATLVIEQGRTIDSQRGLIHQLFEDSAKLTALRGSAAQKARTDTESKTQAQSQPQSSQASPQGWQAKPPDPAPQSKAKNGHSPDKVRKSPPLKPPKATSDEADERRALVSI